MSASFLFSGHLGAVSELWFELSWLWSCTEPFRLLCVLLEALHTQPRASPSVPFPFKRPQFGIRTMFGERRSKDTPWHCLARGREEFTAPEHPEFHPSHGHAEEIALPAPLLPFPCSQHNGRDSLNKSSICW